MSKRKLLIFTIVLTLLITFLPSTANAANNKILNQKRMAERQRFKLVKPTKAQIMAVGSELEYYKQLALEDVDNIYFSTAGHKYSDEIKTIIDDYYESLSNEINGFENESDLLDGMLSFFGMPIPVYKDSVLKKFYTLETLVMLDDKKVDDLSPEEFANEAIMALGNSFDCYSNYKSQYNSYYNSIIQGDKVASQRFLENVTDWLSLAEALGQVRFLVSGYDELYSFVEYLDTEAYCDYDDFDDDDDYYDYSDDDEFLAEELGINTAPDIYIGQRIYSNNEIDSAKEGFKIYLLNYIDRQLEVADYSLDEYLTDIRFDVVNEIEESTNMDEMVSLFERTIEQLVKYTGVEYKDYNNARYKRLIKKMEELRKTYTDDTVYSDSGIYQNGDLIDRAEQLIDNSYIYKDVEVPVDVIDRLTSLLDETLTYSEELKQLKASLVTELKSYKNNKKYNQTKVVPIVNEGIKKINNAKTIENVWGLYDDYYEKAEATIYKFKITTSKVGKGTISKSATIKYGNSYTVKIKPTVGYKISAIYVDGKKVKLTEKYTFKNVTKKHAIKVVFK